MDHFNSNVETDGASNVVAIEKAEAVASLVIGNRSGAVDMEPAARRYTHYAPLDIGGEEFVSQEYIEGRAPSALAIDPAFDTSTGDALVPSQLSGEGGEEGPISRLEYEAIKTAVLIVSDMLLLAVGPGVAGMGNFYNGLSNVYGLLGQKAPHDLPEPGPVDAQDQSADKTGEWFEPARERVDPYRAVPVPVPEPGPDTVAFEPMVL